MIQGIDGTHPQVFCWYDITLCMIDNFLGKKLWIIPV